MVELRGQTPWSSYFRVELVSFTLRVELLSFELLSVELLSVELVSFELAFNQTANVNMLNLVWF